MNRQLLPYVNFLLEHEPSPFCDYILSKELLASGDDTVLDAYDWARRFPLYTELLQEQLPDGSWYGFCDAVTELTKRRKYKTTARAMLRMRDLSLPLSDPMLVKTLALCREYLSGKTLPLELQRKRRPHSIQIELAKREVCRSLSFFSPEDQHVLPFRNAAAEHFRRVCSAGPFDYDTWVQTDSDPTVGTFSYDASIYLLSYRDTLSQQEQRLLLSYEWKRTHFGDVRRLIRYRQSIRVLFSFCICWKICRISTCSVNSWPINSPHICLACAKSSWTPLFPPLFLSTAILPASGSTAHPGTANKPKFAIYYCVLYAF